MSTIGFIGLGIMGRPMATHLVAGGHTLFIYNRSPPAPGLNATLCATAREVAQQADIIITMVPDTPDVEAVWPRIPGRLRGRCEYARRIVDLLALVPDLRLELGEHAAGGEFVFLRWSARGTGPDGPFEGIGTDRLRLRDGLVAESLIMSDLAVFAALARSVERGGDDSSHLGAPSCLHQGRIGACWSASR